MPRSHRNIRPSFALLERMGTRACEALERHRDAIPHRTGLTELPVAAAEFSRLRAEVDGREAECRRLRSLAREALRELAEGTRAWRAMVRRHHRGAVAVPYPRKQVPEDVLGYSEHLLTHVERDRRHGTPPLAFGVRLLEQQRACHARAAELCRARNDAEATLSVRRAALHEAALSLQAELVAFRRVLRRALGPQHADYQAVCFRRRAT